MAARKAAAARRVAAELERSKKELDEWLEFSDDTEKSGRMRLLVSGMVAARDRYASKRIDSASEQQRNIRIHQMLG